MSIITAVLTGMSATQEKAMRQFLW